jgi:hypothetical protein
MPDEALRRVLETLQRAGSCLRRTGAGWQARCPAHDDRNPSLSVTEGRDGRVLLKCRAGCETPAVLAALGLQWSDLFPDATRCRRQS